MKDKKKTKPKRNSIQIYKYTIFPKDLESIKGLETRVAEREICVITAAIAFMTIKSELEARLYWQKRPLFTD